VAIEKETPQNLIKLLEFRQRIASIELDKLAFLDEFRVELSDDKKYARSHQSRVYSKVYKARRRRAWSVITFMHSRGMDRGLAVEGSINRFVMRAYLIEIVIQEFRALGIQYVIMDNLSVHKTKEVREVLEESGIEVIYTPPYSPECNAVEEGISKVKNEIRSNPDKSAENIVGLIGEALDHVTEDNAQGFIRHWRKMTAQS
jgi:transposase